MPLAKPSNNILWLMMVSKSYTPLTDFSAWQHPTLDSHEYRRDTQSHVNTITSQKNIMVCKHSVLPHRHGTWLHGEISIWPSRHVILLVASFVTWDIHAKESTTEMVYPGLVPLPCGRATTVRGQYIGIKVTHANTNPSTPYEQCGRHTNHIILL